MKKINLTFIAGAATLLLAGCQCVSKDHYVNQSEAVNNVVATLEAPVHHSAAKSQVMYFEFDRAELTHSDRVKLDKLAHEISDRPNVTIQVDGYADARGPQHYNHKLGMRRAKAVVAYMADKGFDANQFNITSHGAHNLVDASHSEEAHAKNRRVEISYKINQ